jgi:class 3 adenylate cyclase
VVELPSGTVSMLFSDVEQSTLLLRRLGAVYAEAMDGCRLVQRAAWAAFNGVEMGTEGDSFFVVFSTAQDAVGAAVEAQVALGGFGWPKGEQVRVRMGIHTGTPSVHDGGYVGLDFHRAAKRRIAAAAHGGQVVVPDADAPVSVPRSPRTVGPPAYSEPRAMPARAGTYCLPNARSRRNRPTARRILGRERQ